MKEWYDGYRFGNTEVYCLWEVIRYCKTLCADPNAIPEDYWSNTSLTQRGCAGEFSVQTGDSKSGNQKAVYQTDPGMVP